MSAERGIADGFSLDDDRDRGDVCLLQRGEDGFERLVEGGRLGAGEGCAGGAPHLNRTGILFDMTAGTGQTEVKQKNHFV